MGAIGTSVRCHVSRGRGSVLYPRPAAASPYHCHTVSLSHRTTVIPSHRFTAFSLIELVLVLAIMVILGAVAAPRFASANARYRADFAAQRVAADLQLAQNTARTAGSAVTVSFNVDEDSYSLSGVTALDGTGAYTVNLDESPYLAGLTSAAFGGGSDLVFNGWGHSDSTGTLTLTVGSETRTLTVGSPSGEVTIQ